MEEVAAFLDDASAQKTIKRLSYGERWAGSCRVLCPFKQFDDRYLFGRKELEDVVTIADWERQWGFLTGVSLGFPYVEGKPHTVKPP